MSEKIPEDKNALYIVECEWDIGQVGTLFQSSEDAIEWIREVWVPEELGPISEAFDQGLLSINETPRIIGGRLTEEQVLLTPVVLYGLVTFDDKGRTHLNPYLTMVEAMSEADGDEEPFIMETFKGSNLHIEAEENASRFI